MSERRARRLLVLACGLALVALGLVVWSLLDPRPVPVMVAMSVAQGLGTLSFLLYLGVVLADLRRARVFDPSSPGGRPPADEAPSPEPREPRESREEERS